LIARPRSGIVGAGMTSVVGAMERATASGSQQRSPATRRGPCAPPAAAHILRLQRTAGNRAVARLVAGHGTRVLARSATRKDEERQIEEDGAAVDELLARTAASLPMAMAVDAVPVALEHPVAETFPASEPWDVERLETPVTPAFPSFDFKPVETQRLDVMDFESETSLPPPPDTKSAEVNMLTGDEVSLDPETTFSSPEPLVEMEPEPQGFSFAPPSGFSPEPFSLFEPFSFTASSADDEEVPLTPIGSPTRDDEASPPPRTAVRIPEDPRPPPVDWGAGKRYYTGLEESPRKVRVLSQMRLARLTLLNAVNDKFPTAPALGGGVHAPVSQAKVSSWKKRAGQKQIENVYWNPPDLPNPPSTKAGTGKLAKVKRRGLETGTKTVQGVRPPGWTEFIAVLGFSGKKNKKCVFRQGHLMYEHFGGQGTDMRNLAPFGASLNGRHAAQVEKQLKLYLKAASKKYPRAIDYRVDAMYGDPAPIKADCVNRAQTFVSTEPVDAATALVAANLLDAADAAAFTVANVANPAALMLPNTAAKKKKKMPFSLTDFMKKIVEPWVNKYAKAHFPKKIKCRARYYEDDGAGNWERSDTFQRELENY
jgi:hypothetical protein